jgi:hypothetical protein
MHLIADPPGGPLKGRHRMVVTSKGAASLRAALVSTKPIYTLCQEPPPLELADLSIVHEAAERRPAGRSGYTSGRNCPHRANSNRGSAEPDVSIIVRFLS